MENTEDFVWNRITNSAKTRFDYASFEKDCNEVNKNIAENILFAIIVGFASKETNEAISMKVYNQMLMTGFQWELNDIQNFIEGKDKLFKLEIYLTQLAASLMEEDNDPLAALGAIERFL